MNPVHRNNFDPLRILFAVLVIVSHSVILSGSGTEDWLSRHTGGQTNFSYIGVRGFFVISGFLVFKSLLRSRGLPDFMRKRLLRIFPGLLVMLLVVTFVAGPLVSALPVGEYLRGAWRYPLSELRVFPVPRTESLPGVFTGNPEGTAVNGSLWTIWFELLFYCGMGMLVFIRRRTKIIRIVVVSGWALLALVFLFFREYLHPVRFPLTGMSAEVALDLLLYFAAGAALTVLPWQERRGLPAAALLAGLVLGAAGLLFHGFFYLRYLALPLSVIGFGSMCWPPLAATRRAGEPSYGMYIYAYPVQQALVQLFHPTVGMLTVLTILIAGALGYASWHLVERRALAWGKRSTLPGGG